MTARKLETTSKSTILKRRKALIAWFNEAPVRRCRSQLVQGKRVCALGGAAAAAGIDVYEEPKEGKFPSWREFQEVYRKVSAANDVALKDIDLYYGVDTYPLPEALKDQYSAADWADMMVELNDFSNDSFKVIAKKLVEAGFLNLRTAEEVKDDERELALT